MQIKLNEIIGALHGADNRLINIEALDESDITNLRKSHEDLAQQIQGSNEHPSIPYLQATPRQVFLSEMRLRGEQAVVARWA